jgi:predicted nucleic acid-binding protein
VRVCFDATVLCGALRKPTGRNFRLLELAAEGVLIDGFTTEVAGMEFVCNALAGLGGVRYDIEVIEEFLDAFDPLFHPDNVALSPIGRSLTRETWLHNRPIGEVVYHLTGRTREDLLADLPSQLRVVAGEFDAYDVHLVAAAVASAADVICSSNRRHLPEGKLAGELQIIGPGRLGAELGIA